MSRESEALNDKISRVLKSGRILNRHSIFQLKYFVVGKEPTHQRRLWRCLEELKVRKDGLNALQLQIEETDDNMTICEIALKRLAMKHERRGRTDDLADMEFQVKRRKLERKRKSLLDGLRKLEQTKVEQEEEARFFAESFLTLEQMEPLKPFDDFGSQMEYWNERYAQLLNMRVLLQQPIDTELVSSALALPDKSPVRKQVVSLLENQHKALLALKTTVKPEALPAKQDDAEQKSN